MRRPFEHRVARCRVSHRRGTPIRPTEPDLAPRALARGVWRAPYLSGHGDVVYIAVDRRGRALYQLDVPPGADPRVAIDALAERLASDDPAPTPSRLRLVRQEG